MLTITVLHKCGHVALHNTNATDDKQASQIEMQLSKTYCPMCREAIAKHNSNPKNTYLTIKES